MDRNFVAVIGVAVETACLEGNLAAVMVGEGMAITVLGLTTLEHAQQWAKTRFGDGGGRARGSDPLFVDASEAVADYVSKESGLDIVGYHNYDGELVFGAGRGRHRLSFGLRGPGGPPSFFLSCETR